MKKSAISTHQAICLTALFLLGNSLIFGVGTESGRDGWLALLISAAAAVPVFCVYARIIKLYPRKAFFDLVYTVLGRPLGMAVTFLMTLFALHSASFLLRSASEFVFLTSLPEPPYLLFPAFFILTAMYLLRKGVETLGKWAVLSFVVVMLFILCNTLFSVNDMQILDLLPIMRRPVGELVQASWILLAFPMLQSVLLLPLLAQQGDEFRPRRVLFLGLLIATGAMLLVLLQEILLLGEYNLKNALLPAYTAAKLVSVGDFLSRLEKVASLYILVCCITHMAVCLNAAVRGMARLAGLRDSGGLVVPAGLLALVLSYFVADNLLDMTAFRMLYPWLAALFQLLIPLLLWICAEIRSKRDKAEEDQIAA